ncbi:hypothetical protein [Agrobacterium tumefaciens]|uniref:hypothetical protein n=1 Tax=Agrobacterium tumefaciens TaxID=358 RepID=UPI0021CDEF73|nr:hypothetical protein [Agrobacterium tumefaciens]UXS01086.1 hypothetical protein FY156_06045 [Agrobacterium tumefaciens]
MKTVIECLLGATEQTIGGITYSFDRDEHGRYVNEVNSVLHRSIFLNVVHYKEVPLDPPVPDDQEIPAFLSGQAGAATDAADDSETVSDEDANDEGSDADDGDASVPEAAPAEDTGENEPSEPAPVAPAAKKATSKSK